MKNKYLASIILFFLLSAYSVVNAQSCKKFHLYGACMQYPGANYKIDGQSRSNIIGIGDKLIYNIVLYGSRNYKLFFCATNEFNPVWFVLRDGETGELIYDNQTDGYPETISFKVEKSRTVKIEFSVLATNAPKDLVSGYLGCSGLLMYWTPVKF